MGATIHVKSKLTTGAPETVNLHETGKNKKISETDDKVLIDVIIEEDDCLQSFTSTFKK